MESYFRVFWKEYPHKVNRPAARRQFMAAIGRGVNFEMLMDGVPPYAAYLEATGTYAASPANWIKDERWHERPSLVKPQAARRTYRE